MYLDKQLHSDEIALMSKIISKLFSYLDAPLDVAARIICDGLPNICVKIFDAVKAYERLYKSVRGRSL